MGLKPGIHISSHRSMTRVCISKWAYYFNVKKKIIFIIMLLILLVIHSDYLSISAVESNFT